MTSSTTRTRTRAAERAGRHSRGHASHYPHDYLHNDRSYAETQSDIGGGLLIGAITVIALMTMIVLGLV
ncbi:hypothetical protein BJ986_001203 [Phycicoccus badiiscoriae]|uniref:Uncharacterized protein n=1 Tax=Pedococcus badiiscoriae TaxID=642776 RepID=A0A852WMS3_9MICO|nr:hypothetical protein [Pedococcus badiiscoriae]NYG06716.1 hypothetical protein [Pedococcus badiiscoriae]